MITFSLADQHIMKQIAFKTIHHGVYFQTLLSIKVQDFPSSLQEKKACFVTIYRNSCLRGCIGSLKAYQSLIEDIVYHSFAAAFRDVRFAPITETELQDIVVHLSILHPPEILSYTSESDLIRQLRPQIDGLILRDADHCGTFLPDVWNVFSRPRDFLRHLKQKAGLPENYWSDTLTVERYTVEKIE